MGLHRSKGSESRVLVPITPMLDFTFQLLFFFILTSKPSAQEGEMDLALPSEKPVVNPMSSPDILPSEPGDKDDEPKELPEVTVIVETFPGGDQTGKIQQIFLSLKEKPDERISVTAEDWDPDNPKNLLKKLTEQLQKLRDTLTNKKDIIMKADRKLKWQYIVRVRDACQQAGFENANFARK